ncbi:hypothetical protein JCGZ_04148 [Jatropha curcas]|uniref:RNase H type-1 domain-containing protein n=1 Tax=Jatropha curcas TaxID=180498 RepID=A0A067L5V1_JATCU|nr:hypothetical protein JCGZ_04148 [Jatropha curcas]
MDSQFSLQLVPSRHEMHIRFKNILQLFWSLLDKDWTIRLQYMYREGNAMVDRLANLAVSSSSQKFLIQQPPASVMDSLHFDFQVVYWPRLINSV